MDEKNSSSLFGLADGGAGFLEQEPWHSAPALGPLFLCAAGAWVAVLAIEYVSWSSYIDEFQDADSLWRIVMILLGAVVLAACIRKRTKPNRANNGTASRPFGKNALVVAFALLAAVACIALCASLRWEAWEDDVGRAELAVSLANKVEIDLVGDPQERDYGMVSAAELVLPGRQVPVRIQWPEEMEPLDAGHRIQARGTLLRLDPDESGHWYHKNGYAGTVKLSSAEESGYCPGIRGWLTPFRDGSFEKLSTLGGDASGLMAGVLLGNKTTFAGTELEQDFRTTGLAHLMAVSGTHLAIVSSLAGWLMNLLPFGRRLRVVVLTGLLISYVALTGGAPSAARSCLMCVVGLSAGLARRRKQAINALSLCVLCFLGIEPTIAFSVGFLLSVLAVLGLALFSPLAELWLKALLPAWSSKLVSPVAATLVATITTLPASVPLFVQFPLISPVAMLLVGPLVTSVLGLGVVALILGVLLPAPGAVLLQVDGAIANAAAFIVHVLADAPLACVPLDHQALPASFAVTLLLVLIWAVWPCPPRELSARGRLRACACVFAVPLIVLLSAGMGGFHQAAVGILPGFKSEAEVIQLDVGQGDSMLIHDGTAAVLIDTGEDGAVLKRALARHGVKHLDAVYITHKDADHAGALSALTGVVPVDHVFVHADLLNAEEEKSVLKAAEWATGGRGAEGVRPGAISRIGHFSLVLIAPEKGGKSENNDSLVNLLTYDADGDGNPEARALFSGDAEHEALKDLCDKVGDVDFIKEPHHGSRGGVTAEDLNKLKPEFSLISVGADNSYGHPAQETFDLLAACRVKVYRTDEEGDITVSFSKERLGVSTQR